MNNRSSQRKGTELRQQEILQLLVEQETVTVQELTERFDISSMTAHRDLSALQERGALRKIRGGATAQPSYIYESSLRFRREQMTVAKEMIAREAVEWIDPGSSLAIDNSTTCLAMLPLLVNTPNLTIVTNSLSVLEYLNSVGGGDADVIMVGGVYNSKHHALLGISAEKMIAGLGVDWCFLSASAVDVERGVFHQEPDQARSMQAMLAIAGKSALLIDSSKFGKGALHHVADWDMFDLVVTDTGTNRETVNALRRTSSHVKVAGDSDRANLDGSRS